MYSNKRVSTKGISNNDILEVYVEKNNDLTC